MAGDLELTRDSGVRRDIILHELFPPQRLLVINDIPNQNAPAFLNISPALSSQGLQF